MDRNAIILFEAPGPKLKTVLDVFSIQVSLSVPGIPMNKIKVNISENIHKKSHMIIYNKQRTR